ncbi:glycosyltransferase family 4 protein [Cellulomonas fimi]|uniref:D-inositol 3-phosphate glycosyltransferase n=1 Tax=Cellulomonas fimi (strain ATCC 484 / DSM 20113 / JCM 1341 / CCUG 24087 / LMG 16345 / NBRC 15513 / NCIMB 8980 / NCTC 7547 / NRS-133) TaxID=590998 RepID=F4H2K7_CELFA|nr:glycosyltransferase family 4 protein [Cellulomonas fimi]AEE45233.1 glycosyl transferase group 1 [Cellulomonas fimi ATCC 484]NNH07101.1 glycosyltransferase family 4 protein [Cellulomonas fimi]VEH28655.1 GDP-mannose-dependent alpha-(1-6)-phosphatidylinositol monomannoside mannosyltransferase [Cellulomonas fimi]
MRIVHVSDCFAPRTGGIESQVGDLAARQADRGHEVHVLTATLGTAGERGGIVDVEGGVHVHRLGARLPFDLPVNPAAGPRLLRAAFGDLRPDVVHVHAGVLSPFAFDGARLALDAGLPTAVTWHCMLDGTVPALRGAVRRTRWADAPVALSAVSSAAAARVRDVFDAPVAVVPNGLDLDAWAPCDDDPAVVHDDDAPVRLVSTMRLAPRKRAVPLVELVGAAARRLPRGRLHLSLIGSGPALGRVRSAVSAQGLDDVVDLRGRLPRPQVRAAYAHADVFLAPAELEAFGIAALEARTAGLAIVARRGTGIAEFVTDGVDGLLVTDDAEMTEAVVHLAKDGRLLAGIREHNRTVRPAFGWDDVLGAALAEYERARALR